MVFVNFLNVVYLLLKVTSKGAGLNPNAKVWQEMPVAASEAPAEADDGSQWPQGDITEGDKTQTTLSFTAQPKMLRYELNGWYSPVTLLTLLCSRLF